MIGNDFKWNAGVLANLEMFINRCEEYQPLLMTGLVAFRGRYTPHFVDVHEVVQPLFEVSNARDWNPKENSQPVKLKNGPQAWGLEVITCAMAQLGKETEINKLEGEWIVDLPTKTFWFEGIMVIELTQPVRTAPYGL
jgi:hypothetical protein